MLLIYRDMHMHIRALARLRILCGVIDTFMEDKQAAWLSQIGSYQEEHCLSSSKGGS